MGQLAAQANLELLPPAKIKQNKTNQNKTKPFWPAPVKQSERAGKQGRGLHRMAAGSGGAGRGIPQQLSSGELRGDDGAATATPGLFPSLLVPLLGKKRAGDRAPVAASRCWAGCRSTAPS